MAMPMTMDAAEFLGMWTAMMAVMMLPSLVPMLWRYRQAGALTLLVGAGYFMTWMACGVAALFLMRVPAISHAGAFACGWVLLFAGALQFTAWKAQHLHCCSRTVCVYSRNEGAGTALLHGLRLGFHCNCCCAGSTAILLVSGGFMDMRVMALATAAITAERLAPAGERVAKLIGALLVAAGLWLVARAA